MRELIVVYDTNIIVSAFIGKGAPYNALEAVYDGKVRMVISPEMLIELEDVLSRPKFNYNISQIRKMMTVIVQASIIVEPDTKLDLVKKDPKDNMIIEAAMSGNAKYIITGDTHHLLPLKKVGNIKIISVNEFLKKLK